MYNERQVVHILTVDVFILLIIDLAFMNRILSLVSDLAHLVEK